MASRKKTKAEAGAAYAVVKESDVKKVIEDVGDVQAQVQGTLAGVGVTLASQIEMLQNLDTAIDGQKSVLKDLHGIEAEADTLEQMRERREDEVKADTRARTQRQQAWDDEDAQRQTERMRKVEEHQHAEAQRVEDAKQQLATDTMEAQRHERFRQEDVQRALDLKVSEVSEREANVEALESEVAAFPDVMKAEVEKQLGVITGSIKQAHKHELALLEKDATAAKALASEQIASQSAMLEDLRKQLEVMTTKADAAETRAAQIATDAVEASSGRAALEAVEKANETSASAPTGRGR